MAGHPRDSIAAEARRVVAGLTRRHAHRRSNAARALWIVTPIVAAAVAHHYGALILAWTLVAGFAGIFVSLTLARGSVGWLWGWTVPDLDDVTHDELTDDIRTVGATPDGRRALVAALVALHRRDATRRWRTEVLEAANLLSMHSPTTFTDMTLIRSAGAVARWHPRRLRIKAVVADPAAWTAFTVAGQPRAGEELPNIDRWVRASLDVSMHVRSRHSDAAFITFADGWDGSVDELVDLADLVTRGAA